MCKKKGDIRLIAVIAISVIIVAIVIVLAVVTTSKAYTYKHTVDPADEQLHFDNKQAEQKNDSEKIS